MKYGEIEIIPDESTGEKLIPSVVSFRNDECLIGQRGKNNFNENPESTMFESKRLIGHNFKLKQVQNDIKNWLIK